MATPRIPRLNEPAHLLPLDAWQPGNPLRPGPHPRRLELTASESAFLDHYATTKDRDAAAELAGLTPQRALEVLGKTEHIPLTEIARAVGIDKVLYVATLAEVFLAGDSGSNWRAAATILGKVHGLWDRQAPEPSQTIMIMQSPTCPQCGHEHGTATQDVPFTLPQSTHEPSEGT